MGPVCSFLQDLSERCVRAGVEIADSRQQRALCGPSNWNEEEVCLSARQEGREVRG